MQFACVQSACQHASTDLAHSYCQVASRSALQLAARPANDLTWQLAEFKPTPELRLPVLQAACGWSSRCSQVCLPKRFCMLCVCKPVCPDRPHEAMRGFARVISVCDDRYCFMCRIVKSRQRERACGRACWACACLACFQSCASRSSAPGVRVQVPRALGCPLSVCLYSTCYIRSVCAAHSWH